MTVATQTVAECVSIPRKRDGLCCRSFKGEAVLYDPAHNSAHYLNKTACCIWRQCDGRRTAEEIAAGLVRAFDLDFDHDDARASVMEDVRATLARLADDGLVDSVPLTTHDPAHHPDHA